MPKLRPLPKTVGLLSVVATLSAALLTPEVQQGLAGALGLIGHAELAAPATKVVIAVATMLTFLARSATDPHRCPACDVVTKDAHVRASTRAKPSKLPSPPSSGGMSQ